MPLMNGTGGEIQQTQYQQAQFQQAPPMAAPAYGPGNQLNPYPGLDMYRYGWQQTINENGLWFSERRNARRNYVFGVEFLIPVYRQPGDQMFGYGGIDTGIGATDDVPAFYFSVPRDPGTLGGGTGGGGNNNNNASIVTETELQRYFPTRNFGSMFDDTHADPALRFTGQIYQGAPDATEDLSVDDGTGRAITYGAKASEDGIRTLLEGLHLLAAVQKNDGQFGDAAYRRLATATVGMIDTGSNKIVGIEARLGLVQSDTASFRTEQQATAALLETRISALQDADPYEAATKLASLETQLQASYLATSRILRLSLANVL